MSLPEVKKSGSPFTPSPLSEGHQDHLDGVREAGSPNSNSDLSWWMAPLSLAAVLVGGNRTRVESGGRRFRLRGLMGYIDELRAHRFGINNSNDPVGARLVVQYLQRRIRLGIHRSSIDTHPLAGSSGFRDLYCIIFRGRREVDEFDSDVYDSFSDANEIFHLESRPGLDDELGSLIGQDRLNRIEGCFRYMTELMQLVRLGHDSAYETYQAVRARLTLVIRELPQEDLELVVHSMGEIWLRYRQAMKDIKRDHYLIGPHSDMLEGREFLKTFSETLKEMNNVLKSLRDGSPN